MQTKLNPILLEKITDLGLNPEQVLINHFKIKFNLGYELPKLRTTESSNFYNKNYNTGEVYTKLPLFDATQQADLIEEAIQPIAHQAVEKYQKKANSNLYKKFVDDLIDKGLTSKGNPDKPLSFTAISKTKSLNSILVKLVKTYQYEKIVDTVYHYYINTSYPKTLLNYAKEALEIDLKSDSNTNSYDLVI